MERLFFEFAIRAALIFLTTAVMLRVLRIRIAAAQHAVWAGVLIVMLALPLWIAWGPKATLPVLPGEPAAVMSADPASLAAPAPPLEVSETPATKPVWSWDAVFAGVYLLGALALLLRLAIGTIRASRLNSAACAAPVTVGLLRPRIILPDRWREWPQVQLDAVLTHERAHARRRDPLFQWLALFNRAVFWFHPLAWWLERRMSALAEEACDAAVLERGHDPREYSECLLDLARAVQRAGTRVNVMALAMPGSYLPQRVKKIIDGVRAPRVSPMRMACTAVACAIPAALFAAGTLEHVAQIQPYPVLNLEMHAPSPVTPVSPVAAEPAEPAEPARKPSRVLLAQAKAAPPPAPPKLEFEVASVRPVSGGGRGGGSSDGPGPSGPERITFSGGLVILFKIVYGVDRDPIVGPDWFQTQRYDIVAKVPPGTTKEQVNVMFQNLLADRFHLSFHRVMKDFPQYELVVAKGGPKLKETADPNLAAAPPAPADPESLRNITTDRNGFPQPPPGRRSVGRYQDGLMRWTFRAFSIQELVVQLGSDLATPVTTGRGTVMGRITDHTGLTGKYDFTLEYASSFGFGGALNAPAGQDPGPDIFEAVEKQLGLKLEKTKAPLEVLIIDHVEKPDEN